MKMLWNLNFNVHKVLLEPRHISFSDMMSVTAFAPRKAELRCFYRDHKAPDKATVLTLWSFTGKVCLPLIYNLNVSVKYYYIFVGNSLYESKSDIQPLAMLFLRKIVHS